MSTAAPPAYEAPYEGPSEGLLLLIEKSPSTRSLSRTARAALPPSEGTEVAVSLDTSYNWGTASHEAPPSYEVAMCEHDPHPLPPSTRALKIGICVANPALGLALALCPSRRERVCKSCGDCVVVPMKKFFT